MSTPPRFSESSPASAASSARAPSASAAPGGRGGFPDADQAQDLLGAVLPLAEAAGREVLAVYTAPFRVDTKDDASPVTEADTRAEAVILEGLARLTPRIPVVAEESMAAGRGPRVDRSSVFWLVDPLDGTKEFIKRNGEFTVNIGLVVAGVPVLGVVHCPALDLTYWGGVGDGAHMRSRNHERTIACRPPPARGLTVVASRSHGSDAALADLLAARRWPVAERLVSGSSLKFCRIAEGEADLYPRLGPTCEWDTCAADAVLRAAGGTVTTLDDQPLTYGKGGDFLNPHFLARGPGV